jgi:hypothetical protein
MDGGSNSGAFGTKDVGVGYGWRFELDFRKVSVVISELLVMLW